MTEKITDLAERINKAAMASCVESFCMEVADSIENEIGRGLTEQEHQQISETASVLLVAQDQLEAALEQVARLDAENTGLHLIMGNMRDNAEPQPRGAQEPVGIFAGTDECSEVRHISWLPSASKLQSGDKLFTHQPKPVVVLPEGWKLVPIEPTEDMVISGFESKPSQSFSSAIEWEAYDAMSGCQQAAYRAKLCWDAMLRAAPKPEM